MIHNTDKMHGIDKNMAYESQYNTLLSTTYYFQ